MSIIFEVTDKTGRKIHLTKERWTHITSPTSLHPYMTNYIEETKETLKKPDNIISNSIDDKKADYYKYYKKEGKFLKILVKYLNGKGYIITAYLTQKRT